MCKEGKLNIAHAIQDFDFTCKICIKEAFIFLVCSPFYCMMIYYFKLIIWHNTLNNLEV